MADDHGDAAMVSYVKTPWEAGDMPTVIAKLQQSGSIYFHKLLARLPNRKFGQFASLVVPVRFINEHADKFEEWTILWTQSSSIPWRVRFSVYKKNESPQVKFMGGWKRFAADNRLKEGDLLVFVLNVNAISEFQVYIFRSTGRSSSNPQTPARKWCNNIDGAKLAHQQTVEKSYAGKYNLRSASGENITKTGDLSIGEKKAVEETRHENLEEENSMEHNSGASSEVHTGTECKGLESQHGPNSLQPCFRRLLMKTNYKHGLFEVPASFVTAHSVQLRDEVKLQGIYEDSPVRIVTRHYQKQGNQTRLYFKGGWSGFSKENGLHVGQELQFTLISESFFIVRVV